MAVPKFNNGDEPPTSIFANQLKKKKKERNVEAGSILLFLQREEKIRHSVDRSREENVLGEDGSAEELEEAGSPFA